MVPAFARFTDRGGLHGWPAGERTGTAFQRGDPLVEDDPGRVVDPRGDAGRIDEPEQTVGECPPARHACTGSCSATPRTRFPVR